MSQTNEIKSTKNFEDAFHEIDDKLSLFGFSKDDKFQIYSKIIAILHIGNIDYHRDDDSSIQAACRLLNIEQHEMEHILWNKSINDIK